MLSQLERSSTITKLIDFLESFTDRINFSRKIVLIHCPTFSFEAFRPDVLRNRGYYVYPPRALQCLASAVHGIGIKADILDLNYLLLKELIPRDPSRPVRLYEMLTGIVDLYLKNNPEVNIFGVSTGVIVPNMFQIGQHPFLEVLKHLTKNNDGLVLAGGPCATIEAKRLVEDRWAHVVFKGESEDSLCYFLRLLFGQRNIPSHSGICFLGGDEFIETNGYGPAVNFQKSVVETYESVRVEEYHKAGCLGPFSRMVGQDEPFATVQLIRGCRMKCSFCGLTQYRGTNKVCRYPTDLLFEEIEFLVNKRGIRHLSWVDEDLLADRESFVEILQRIIKARLPITWAAPIGIIAVFLDEELLRLMSQSGCIGFRIGIESGNEEMLRKIRKPATKNKLREVALRLKAHPEFFVCGFYMLGFEGETYAQMFETLEFTLEMNLAWSHFSVYHNLQETKTVKDWVPSSQKVIGSSKVNLSMGEILTPLEIFQAPHDEIHDPEWKQDLWFAFNLVANYLCNKSFHSGGNIDQFISWTLGLQATYPEHPLISLFISLAFLRKGDRTQADSQLQRTKENLEQSQSWRKKFEAYNLSRIIERYPLSGEAVSRLLLEIAAGYRMPFSVYKYCKPL